MTTAYTPVEAHYNSLFFHALRVTSLLVPSLINIFLTEHRSFSTVPLHSDGFSFVFSAAA